MYFVYIIESLEHNRFYIGVTANLQERLKKHNGGSTKSTKPFRPWQLVYTEGYRNKSKAYKREFYLKHPKGYLEKRKIIDKIKDEERSHSGLVRMFGEHM